MLLVNRLAVSLSAVLGLSLFLAPAASAVVHSYTVTGSVLFLSVEPGYFLDDTPAFFGGETFVLTFDLDDASPQTSTNGTTVATYGAAISNWNLTFSNGPVATASTGGVLAAIGTGGGGLHQWSNTYFLGSPTFSTSLVQTIFATDENTFETEVFELQTVDFSMFDLQSTGYSSTPPELLAPTLAVFETPDLEIIWASNESSATIAATISVSGVTVASGPAAVPVFGFPGLAVLVAGLGVVGGTAVRRRSADRDERP
ncbi:MAG: hypothetical protein AB8G23_02805 [Myxococcota bacterium]